MEPRGLQEGSFNRETIYSGLPRGVALLVMPMIKAWSQKACSAPLWISSPSSLPGPHLGCGQVPPCPDHHSTAVLASAPFWQLMGRTRGASEHPFGGRVHFDGDQGGPSLPSAQGSSATGTAQPLPPWFGTCSGSVTHSFPQCGPVHRLPHARGPKDPPQRAS